MIPTMNRPSFKNAPVPWQNPNPAPPKKKDLDGDFFFGTTKKRNGKEGWMA